MRDIDNLDIILGDIKKLLDEAYAISGDCGVWIDEDEEAMDADAYIGDALVSIREAIKWVEKHGEENN